MTRADVEAACDQHMTVADYNGSTPGRLFVLTDNYGADPVSITLGDDDNVGYAVDRLKRMRT